MKLIQPNIRLKDTFIKVIKDYKKNEEWHYYYKYEEALTDFESYLESLRKSSLGKELPEGDVPTTTYWLTDNSETEIRGIIRIRHIAIPIHGNIGYDVPPEMRFKGYGEELLRLGLIKARELGIKEVLVTCGAGNKGSRRIIEKNGGRCLRSSMDNFERFDQYIVE